MSSINIIVLLTVTHLNGSCSAMFLSSFFSSKIFLKNLLNLTQVQHVTQKTSKHKLFIIHCVYQSLICNTQHLKSILSHRECKSFRNSEYWAECSDLFSCGICPTVTNDTSSLKCHVALHGYSNSPTYSSTSWCYISSNYR